ncbi:MAG TPA: DNA polymerase IV [Patescibacteria group bacterium]|nr:DNA polymerase IV [Patescibacteria group bacterium]
MDTLFFNPNKSYVMHIDVNSCFATVEQQANPFLRGKALVVAAYNSPGGCVLAASTDAKKLGIKTGMRVKEAKLLCPIVLVLTPDPDKYRFVHLGIRKIVSYYTNDFSPKSIDEFVLNLENYPALKNSTMKNIGVEIKNRIKKEIGDYITVSVGISTNKFLAKAASNLKKPDGLEEINKDNFLEIYSKLKLTDLTGIASHNEARLNRMGIMTVLDLYNSPIWKIKSAFHSITGYYWYLRLRGIEIDNAKEVRRTFGNSYAIPSSNGTLTELYPILATLVEKTGFRLRRAGYFARGVNVNLFFKDHTSWQKSQSINQDLFDSRDILTSAISILNTVPNISPVHTIAVSVFKLNKKDSIQGDLFQDVYRKRRFTEAVDTVNKNWGSFSLMPAGILKNEHKILDRIAFGGVREL